MLTYADCAESIKTARDPDGRGKPIANNTTLHRVRNYPGDNPDAFTYVVRLHATNIIEIDNHGDPEDNDDDEYIIRFNGWDTPTTWERIRRFAPCLMLKTKVGAEAKTDSYNYIVPLSYAGDIPQFPRQQTIFKPDSPHYQTWQGQRNYLMDERRFATKDEWIDAALTDFRRAKQDKIDYNEWIDNHCFRFFTDHNVNRVNCEGYAI